MVVAASVAWNSLSITERIAIVSPTVISPRACIRASRAALPVPQGERSRRPGCITVPLRQARPGEVGGAQNMTKPIRRSSGMVGCRTAIC